MSLDISINYKAPQKDNYFLNHPYYYFDLSESDLNRYDVEHYWSGNVTHNLGKMASQVPIVLDDGKETDFYHIIWRPEEIFDSPNTSVILKYLVDGINYMISHRIELLPYEPSNGWGTYNGFIKFLLNYKQACENNPDCFIEASR